MLLRDSKDEPSWTLTLMMIPFVMTQVYLVLGFLGIVALMSVLEYTGACATSLAPILVRKGINTHADATVAAAQVVAAGKIEEANVIVEAKAEAVKVERNV